MFFSSKKKCIAINLPDEIKEKVGICALPVHAISLNESFSGPVLCIQDNPVSIRDLSKIRNLHLHVKAGGVNTSYGTVIFLLFMFWDINRENDKFTYEVILNPSDFESYEQYLLLDAKRVWEVLIVHRNEVLNIYEFENVYNIGNGIKKLIEIGRKKPCLNFLHAKEEFFKDYAIEGLIKQP